ncbi:MAG TPA: O-antigen ligase family protein [Gaiellales bacterium]
MAPLPRRRRALLTENLTPAGLAVSLRRLSFGQAAPGLLAAAVLTPLAAGNGGYFPPAWGWSAAALLWAAAIAVLVRQEVETSVAEVVTVSAFGLLTVWMLISATWSGDTTSAVLEAERTLVYVAGLLALLLVSRRGAIGSLLAGALCAVAVASAYGLVGRLFPSVHAVGGIADTGRLAEPVGYWNGLGILAAMGAIIALGLAAHARTVPGRIIAIATLPVMVSTLYFTYSRGAWIAFAFGLAAAIAVDRRRWFLLATVIAAAPLLVLDVLVAATSPALTHAASLVGPAASEGHQLALVILISMVGLTVIVCGLHILEQRFVPSAAVTRFGHIATLTAIVLIVLFAIVRFGSPIAIATDTYNRFNEPPPGGFNGKAGHVGKNLNLRLFSLSGNARAQLWRIAWADVKSHEALGSGAGTYEQYYLQHRKTGLQVRNAHNLYLETLADLGPVGLLLLIAGLAAPLVAGIRARGQDALVPVAFGGFAAYLLHAGADWDWQMTAITLTALTCAVGLLTSAPPGMRPLQFSARGVRAGILAALAVLAVCALVGLRGNAATAASQRAASAGHWVAAEGDARTAVTWEPWSADARVALGAALLGEGRNAEARTAFEAAIAREPRSWVAWYDLARASTGTARQNALTHARRLDPHEPQLTALQ